MPLEVSRIAVDYSETRLVLPMARLITTLRRGDTRPPLTAQLVQPDGTPMPLAGATVTFRMRNSVTREEVVSAAATIVSPGEGLVRYDWQAADTAEAGDYEARFVVDDGSGGLTSFPNYSLHPVRIEP